MRIKNLKIDNFRNYKSLKTEFFEGTNIFYGDNASGKTNLLEAIFVLCLGRSHRGAQDNILVMQDADTYRLEGHVDNEEREWELTVAYQRGGRKKVTIDKIAVRTSELYDNFCVVTAGPEDSNIISGSPSERRSFIDIYLSQYSQKYLYDLMNYQKILSQKNAALKNEMDPAPFNELMIETGSKIIHERIRFINEIGVFAKESYKNISGGSDFSLEYKPSVKLNDAVALDDVTDAYRRSLDNNYQREQIMATSLVGPHRDDLYFTVDGNPARSHGSQGEWRTASISLKIGVHQIIKRKRNITPLLLLDEIFAELDHKRSEALVNSFGDFKQLFLTTAVEPPAFLKQNSRSFKIDKGEIISID